MDSTPLTLPGPDSLGIDRMQFFRDCESGGAWPFLVRGVNCLLNCDNGRDLCLVIAGRAVLCVCVRGGGVRGGEGERSERRGRGEREGEGEEGPGEQRGRGWGAKGETPLLQCMRPHVCVLRDERRPLRPLLLPSLGPCPLSPSPPSPSLSAPSPSSLSPAPRAHGTPPSQGLLLIKRRKREAITGQ